MTEEPEVAREWGPWSVWKTEILLGGYLPIFTRAGTRSQHRTFIDGFAGANRNVERGTGRTIMSSPRLALSAKPSFTHVLCFEIPARAAGLKAALLEEFPGRTVEVIGGDVNQDIDAGLRWWEAQGGPREGPVLGQTLVYLDPNSLQLSWETVEKIVRFREQSAQPGGFRRLHRPELLVLFPTGPLRRRLPQPPKAAATDAAQQMVDRLLGNEDWRQIYSDQRSGVIVGEDSWLHYVEQYRWQLARVGYKHTSAIEVRNTRNVVQYHMVFATTNDAGREIFTAVLEKARITLPRMIDDELRRVREDPHAPRLFEDSDEEVSRVAADPTTWARLFTTPPQAYAPGKALPNESQATDDGGQQTLF